MMPPILEFADAKSWGAGAFIAGLLGYGIFRILFVSDSRYADKLAKFSAHFDALNAELTALRLNYEEQASKATYYEGEFNKLFATYQTLTQIADEVLRRKNDLATAKKETEAQAQENEQLKSEVARLSAALFSAYADLRNTLREQEIAKRDLRQVQVALQNSTAAIEMQAQAQENEQLKSEVARHSAALFSAYADLRNTLREQEIAKRDLRQVQVALQNSTAPKQMSLG